MSLLRPSLAHILNSSRFYPGAALALDFTQNKYRVGLGEFVQSASFLGLSGLTFSRTGAGYAETSSGTLVSFATGIPRITDKGILIEEARTNLLLRSQEFDNASWGKVAQGVGSNPVVTADAGIAPDGTMTADRAVFATNSAASGDRSRLQQGVTLTASTAYRHTVWIKSNDGQSHTLTFLGTGIAALVQQNSVVTTDWQRFEFPITTGVGETAFTLWIGLFGNVDTNADILIWGAQLEAGAFPTSYIPTTTASATRGADSAIITQAFGSEYTALVEAIQTANASSANFYDISDGAGTNAEQVEALAFAGDIICRVRDGSSDQCSINVGAVASGASFKAAFTVKADDFRACRNGGAVTADAAGTMPTVDRIAIGHRVSANRHANSYIKKLVLHPRRFTDAELQALSA